MAKIVPKCSEISIVKREGVAVVVVVDSEKSDYGSKSRLESLEHQFSRKPICQKLFPQKSIPLKTNFINIYFSQTGVPVSWMVVIYVHEITEFVFNWLQAEKKLSEKFIIGNNNKTKKGTTFKIGENW